MPNNFKEEWYNSHPGQCAGLLSSNSKCLAEVSPVHRGHNNYWKAKVHTVFASKDMLHNISLQYFKTQFYYMFVLYGYKHIVKDMGSMQGLT